MPAGVKPQQEEWLTHQLVATAALKDLGRLENWAERNLTKFNQGKHKVLSLGRNNPTDQYRLGAEWLESRFREKDQGALQGNKLPMSQQCGCVAKQAYSPLGSIQERFASRSREVILPL